MSFFQFQICLSHPSTKKVLKRSRCIARLSLFNVYIKGVCSSPILNTLFWIKFQNDGKAESYMKKSKQSKTKFKNLKQVIV